MVELGVETNQPGSRAHTDHQLSLLRPQQGQPAMRLKVPTRQTLPQPSGQACEGQDITTACTLSSGHWPKPLPV